MCPFLHTQRTLLEISLPLLGKRGAFEHLGADPEPSGSRFPLAVRALAESSHVKKYGSELHPR